MNDHHHIEDIMNKNRPIQSPEARSALLARVLNRVHEPATARVIVSPYRHYMSRYMLHLSIVAAVLLVAGTGGTVVLANAAKPGDYLFSLDRATEELRLFLATEGKRTELEVNYLDERLRELETIVQETKAHQIDAGQGTDLTADNVERLNLVIDTFLAQANQVNMQVSADRREAAVALLDTIELDLPGNIERVRLDNDRIEIRTDEVWVRERNGVMEVKYRSEDDSNEYDIERIERPSDTGDDVRRSSSDENNDSYESNDGSDDPDNHTDDSSHADRDVEKGENDDDKEKSADKKSEKNEDKVDHEEDDRSNKRDDN